MLLTPNDALLVIDMQNDFPPSRSPASRSKAAST